MQKLINKSIIELANSKNVNLNEIIFQADLQTLLRNEFNIEVKVWAEYYLNAINWNVQSLKFNLSKAYSYLGFIESGTMIYGDDGQYNTYEEALEKGLELGLNLI